MLPAGMVADSSPRNAHSVSAAAAGTLVASERSPVSAMAKCDASKWQAEQADQRERQQLQDRRHDLHPAGRAHARRR